jgi:hypothetical protein
MSKGLAPWSMGVLTDEKILLLEQAQE